MFCFLFGNFACLMQVGLFFLFRFCNNLIRTLGISMHVDLIWVPFHFLCCFINSEIKIMRVGFGAWNLLRDLKIPGWGLEKLRKSFSENS